ncbi:glycoside hydrolase family 127 protein [Sphingomonas sp. 1P08PE]|uniref:glycoside hydrolase family 127 protein n=1 Tax=Sphingomonas sp. 1P08PE TaxID=554122 RepID=UPI0039A0424F
MIDRRALLVGGSVLAAGAASIATAAMRVPAASIRPLPLKDVRLTPSIWADAVEANRGYVMSLEADRLLHNFRKGAGLQPKGAIYAGWEDQSIAGHTLGHYMSALALLYAQTDDEAPRSRLRYVVSELAETQGAHGDGYVGGTTIERDGRTIDGKVAFEELRRRKISPNTTVLGGFNDSWVPLYTWHKVHAGVIDAIQIAGIREAEPVLRGMSDYMVAVFAPLSDAEVQTVLDQEFGGLNDSFANAFAVTGDDRYLIFAKRLRHRKVLDPLAAGHDELAGLHANTQIPKVIGLARLYELDGDPRDADAARFFHRTVTENHSYVIGGNSDRESFGTPRQLSTRVSDRTCEHCNTYNMLKLTRHLYGWQPRADLFDFYERAHLNHVMASQNPKTGAFVYYMPLSSGAKRTYSSPTDHFWCCVGSGMESHAKHGDSIYWEDGSTLYVNLFIPSRLDWTERGLQLEMHTQFPYGSTVKLVVSRPAKEPLAMALRVPAWAAGPSITINGAPTALTHRNGYAILARRWHAGDTIELSLPMTLKVEAMPDDPRLVAFRHGPVVLAADLGDETGVWHGIAPALLTRDAAAAVRAVEPERHVFAVSEAAPTAVTLRPFFDQYDQRTAVYFPLLDKPEWDALATAHAAAELERKEVERRTIDLLQPTDSAQERAHSLTSKDTEIWSYGGRGMRMAWYTPGSFVEASLKVEDGPMVLRALYWGEDVGQDFLIEVNSQILVREKRAVRPVKRFVAVEYALPLELTRGRERVRVRFTSAGSAASVYELRTVRPV